jgi:hypothetical protein
VATEKQRRRRAKEKRHAYDLVEIDAEGNETVISASEVRSDEPRKAKPRERSASRTLRGTAQPPSWPKVVKRGLLISPIFFVLVLLLGGKNVTIVGALINAIFLLLVFVPFSYFLDSFVWRRHEKSRQRPVKR